MDETGCSLRDVEARRLTVAGALSSASWRHRQSVNPLLVSAESLARFVVRCLVWEIVVVEQWWWMATTQSG